MVSANPLKDKNSNALANQDFIFKSSMNMDGV
jgi:hypothetical protein